MRIFTFTSCIRPYSIMRLLFHAVKSKYKVMPDYFMPLCVSLLSFPPLHSEVTSKEFQHLWIIYSIPPFKPLTPLQMCRQWGLKYTPIGAACMYTLCQNVCVCIRVTVAENIKWYITNDSWSTSLSLALSLSLSLRHTPHTVTGTHQSIIIWVLSEWETRSSQVGIL